MLSPNPFRKPVLSCLGQRKEWSVRKICGRSKQGRLATLFERDRKRGNICCLDVRACCLIKQTKQSLSRHNSAVIFVKLSEKTLKVFDAITLCEKRIHLGEKMFKMTTTTKRSTTFCVSLVARTWGEVVSSSCLGGGIYDAMILKEHFFGCCVQLSVCQCKYAS